MTRPQFIHALALVLMLTLPCLGCTREKSRTFVSSSSLGSPEISRSFGVNIDFTDPRPGEFKLLSEAGFHWVRMDLKWDETEKEPGHYDFSSYDRLLKALGPFNIRTLFILDYGNPLYDHGAPPRTEATRQAFARWAVAAAQHFAGRGAFWEVYNEPNHSTFWPPQSDAQEYVALALAVGRAFREAVPNEKLVGPATSEIDFAFVESCLQAGLLEYWAAVSVHPYRRTDPETAAADYCRLRDLIKTYATKFKIQTREIPIISSEWGYSSVWPGMSDETQAELLARSWLTNAANGIALSIWYDWRDDGLNPNEPEHHFGTVFNSYHDGREPVYDAKPAYFAAKTFTTFFSGYRFEKRIDLGSDKDYLLVFRNGDAQRFAAWTTGSAHKVLLPFSPALYTGIQHTGQDLGPLGEQKELTITLTNAPIYFRSSLVFWQPGRFGSFSLIQNDCEGLLAGGWSLPGAPARMRRSIFSDS